MDEHCWYQTPGILGAGLAFVMGISILWQGRTSINYPTAATFFALGIGQCLAIPFSMGDGAIERMIDQASRLTTATLIFHVMRRICSAKNIPPLGKWLLISIPLIFLVSGVALLWSGASLFILRILDGVAEFVTLILMIITFSLLFPKSGALLPPGRKVLPRFILGIVLLSCLLQMSSIVGLLDLGSLLADYAITIGLTVFYVARERSPHLSDYIQFAKDQLLVKVGSVDPSGLRRQIEFLFENERVYLNEDLRLQSLASELGVTTRTVSTILNQELGTNFADYVNGYRIREAGRQLNEEPESSITTIAFAVGFNSLASFHRAFHKTMGRSAREFRRNGILG